MAETTTHPGWTVLSLLLWAAAHLGEKGFEEARLTADLLLAHVLGLRRMDLYLQYDRPLTEKELAAFKTVFKRRLHHEPLQYITGETVFMGHTLELTPAVLIPRPETEVLVEASLEALTRMTLPAPRVLDVGTGSGNIAIAIASRLPHAEVRARELREEALEVARRNVARHVPGRVTLESGDLFGDLSGWGDYDLIVSNPPYVSREEYETLQPEIREFEPRAATTDEDDGLRFLRRLCDVSRTILRRGGVLCVEIAADRGAEALEIAHAPGLTEVEILPDLSRLPRVLRARRQREDRP
jgi:release factor glutamine methyltransferase